MQISEGDRTKIDTTVQFTGKVSVKLYEKDVEGDDYLGQQVLEPGSKDGIMEFTKRLQVQVELQGFLSLTQPIGCSVTALLGPQNGSYGAIDGR